MKPDDPKGLEYASLDTPSAEDDRQQRYYREPPNTGDLMVIGFGLLFLLSFLCYWVFRSVF